MNYVATKKLLRSSKFIESPKNSRTILTPKKRFHLYNYNIHSNRFIIGIRVRGIPLRRKYTTSFDCTQEHADNIFKHIEELSK